ncbi:pca operon transcription factor PcaQ [Actibacterium ureilyticum]|uniref:pca operon transcription factor PcaQ n=1 Tax=Actibacterium ureilyticum TaxID=1590614 RepID=UPI000BAB1431|nr:pca operon transcription factor PcaQ [Actibacterium ureilyticum]
MATNKAKQIKMRHLSAFVESTRAGSLKLAAERLFLTQPAISKTLKDLEEILGVSLMDRGRGGLSLTREGEVLLPFAEQSLAALEHGLSSLEAINAGDASPLRVGALPSVAADLLPVAVDVFARLSPATPVTVEEGRISSMLEHLRMGYLEFVIGRLGKPETMIGLSFTQLYAENVVFAVAADHPLAQGCELEDIANWLVLYPPATAAIRSFVDRFMITKGIGRLPDRLDTVSGAFGRSMTLGPRKAIWIISEGVVSRDIAAGRMVALPLDTSAMAGPIGIMARSEEDPTPPMRLFRQALLAARDQTRGLAEPSTETP